MFRAGDKERGWGKKKSRDAARRGAEARQGRNAKRKRDRAIYVYRGGKPPAERDVTFQDLRRIDYDAIFNGPTAVAAPMHLRATLIANIARRAGLKFRREKARGETIARASYESVNSERATMESPKLLVTPSRDFRGLSFLKVQ